MIEKSFVCGMADKEALDWISKNFKKLKSLKVLGFEQKGSSHKIKLGYEFK